LIGRYWYKQSTNVISTKKSDMDTDNETYDETDTKVKDDYDDIALDVEKYDPFDNVKNVYIKQK